MQWCWFSGIIVELGKKRERRGKEAPRLTGLQFLCCGKCDLPRSQASQRHKNSTPFLRTNYTGNLMKLDGKDKWLI